MPEAPRSLDEPDVVAALRGVMREGFIDDWLHRSVPALSGDSPQERLDSGDAEAVYRVIVGLVAAGAA